MRKVRLTKAIATASLSIVALLGTSACGENKSSQASIPSGAETEAPDSAPSPADDVRGVTLSGETFSLREALQDKPVVLWFWAPG